MGEKRAPVQGYSAGIPWEMHLRAYDVHCARYSPQPALIDGGCRGGFGVSELDQYIPGWRDEVEALPVLKHALQTCIKAHQTGRFEPIHQAIEHAQNVLEDLECALKKKEPTGD